MSEKKQSTESVAHTLGIFGLGFKSCKSQNMLSFELVKA